MKLRKMIEGIALLLAVSLLSGCNQAMTNQEIISANKLCADNGLKTRTYINGWTGVITLIQCVPSGVTP